MATWRWPNAIGKFCQARNDFFFKLLLKKKWRGCDYFFPSFAQYPRVLKNQIVVREEKGKEWIGEERRGVGGVGELSESDWITQWHSIKNRRASKDKNSRILYSNCSAFLIALSVFYSVWKSVYVWFKISENFFFPFNDIAS